MDEQEIIRAIKGLTRRSNIKLEHLQMIEDNLGENNKQFWQQLFAKNNNVKLAFREKIYTSEMVRLLTLRTLILPETKSELLAWLQEGLKQNKDTIQYFANFKQEINYLIQNNKKIFTKINQTISICDFLFIELLTNIEKEFNLKKNIFLFLIRSFIYPILGKNALASTDYNKALEINLQLALAYYNRGLAYSDLKIYTNAIADLNKAIEINPQIKIEPEFAYAYNGRGLAYYNLQKYQEAIADYNKALEIDPQLAEAYNNRGLAYYNLQKYQEAIADYNKALEIDPQFADAYYNRGNAAVEAQNRLEAEAQKAEAERQKRLEAAFALSEAKAAIIQASVHQSEINRLSNEIAELIVTTETESKKFLGQIEEEAEELDKLMAKLAKGESLTAAEVKFLERM